MAQITIDIEEYKELLTLKISKDFEEEIQNLKSEAQQNQTNSEYWWREWRDASNKVKELQAKLDELTKEEDCDAS